MSDPEHKTPPPEPQSGSDEKPSIRKSQEEFVDDNATTSIDRSEYEPGKDNPDAPTAD